MVIDLGASLNVTITRADISGSDQVGHHDSDCAPSFLPVIYKPIRITHTYLTLIDHISSNLTCKEILSGIILTDVADHFDMLCIVIDTNRVVMINLHSLFNVNLLKPT